MIWQFIFYLADGGAGRGPDSKVTRSTAVNHVVTFFGAFKYCNRELGNDIRDQVPIWARYDLTEELGPNKGLAISKPIAHRGDAALILR